MRHMSFALTTEQMENRSKTVTRRLRWRHAKPGQVVRPIFKGQGLKKGEKIRYLTCGRIRFVAVRFEPLYAITPAEVVREGFPEMSTFEFITMFCQANHCLRVTEVTRIEFVYVDCFACRGRTPSSISPRRTRRRPCRPVSPMKYFLWR